MAIISDEGMSMNPRADLLHFHVCIHCGHPRRREDVENPEITSGILHCPKCGLDGPLHIEIRERPQPDRTAGRLFALSGA